MSQNFKLKFDQMRDGDPTQGETESTSAAEIYPTSNVRNLCLVWPDGKRMFLNYAYLISGEFTPDQGEIKLTFTSLILILKGSGLGDLFEEISWHLTKQIVCIDERYLSITEGESVVTEMFIMESPG